MESLQKTKNRTEVIQEIIFLTTLCINIIHAISAIASLLRYFQSNKRLTISEGWI